MKKTIYLLPGFMCNEQIFSKLLPLVEDSYNFIYLKIPQKNTIDEIINQLYNILKDEEKINILGFSLGGYLAISFGLKYPEKVDKLMAVSSSINSLPKEEIEKREHGLKIIKSFGFKNLSVKTINHMLEEKDNKELIRLIQNMYTSLGEENLYSQMSSTLNRENLTKKLENSSLKTCFFYSLKDRLVDEKAINKIVSNNQYFYQERIDSTSHMLTLEKPEKLANCIKNWFT